MPSDLPILSAAGLFRPTSSSSASGVEGIAEVDDAIENEETVIETGEVTLDALIQAAEAALATKTSTIVESGGGGGLGSTGGTYAARPAGVTGAILYVGADDPTTSSAANSGAPALATDVWLPFGAGGTGGGGGTTYTGTAPIAVNGSVISATIGTTAGTLAAGNDARFLTVASDVQTSSYTLALSDAGEVVEMNSASATTVTVPPNSSVNFPVGTVVEVCQYGAGQVTLAGGSGVTMLTPASMTTRAQYSTVAVRQRAANQWVVTGDLT
jgi:hypothetical protein